MNTTTQNLRDAYYARVAPLFSEALGGKSVGILGGARCGEIALLLARCGVRAFAAADAGGLLKRLREQNPLEDRFRAVEFCAADVLVAGPGAPAMEKLPAATLRLAFNAPDGAVRARIDVLAPGDTLEAVPDAWPADPFDADDAVNRAAALARSLLLRGTAAGPALSLSNGTAEIASFLQGRKRPCLLLGHARWPWWLRACEREDAAELFAQPADARWRENAFAPPAVRRGRVLVVGCGSLGSVAALQLAPRVETLLLCDPECVSVENPVRQAFALADVGRPKAEALADHARRLGAQAESFVRAEDDSAEGRAAFAEFLDRTRPDFAVLTTGTAAEYSAAAVLRERGIPHAAARCYARARYFEIILVDGAAGPCFHCLREQVHTGPPPSLTPEQQARYDPAYRPGELNAEPASIVESGRCAQVLARCAAGLLRAPEERPHWLRELLSQERTCLIGSNHAERDERGAWAYNLDAPGKVATYGPEDIAGARPGTRCGECGRVF